MALELQSVRLRDFSLDHAGPATLICAPFALHGATIADFAKGHSLVEALRGAGCQRLLVTDWRSATPEMRYLSIDSYLADCNVIVDSSAASISSGYARAAGWRSPLRRAFLKSPQAGAGRRADRHRGGESSLSRLAAQVRVFRELVETGHGRILGRHALALWVRSAPTRRRSQKSCNCRPTCRRRAAQARARFRTWYEWTVDLPGTYYLEVVQRLYKENRLAKASFVALGRRISLKTIRVPLFLLAAKDDDVVAPSQLFAAESLVSLPQTISKATAPGGHLGLFMGATTLAVRLAKIARWLAEPCLLADDLCAGSLRGPSEAREPGVHEHRPRSWRTIRVHGFRVPFARFAGFGPRNGHRTVQALQHVASGRVRAGRKPACGVRAAAAQPARRSARRARPSSAATTSPHAGARSPQKLSGSR